MRPHRRELHAVRAAPPATAAEGSPAETNSPWFRQVSRPAWWALAMGGLGRLCESDDSLMLSLTLPVLSQDFALDKAQAGALIGIRAAGRNLGGDVSDRIGRVRTADPCVPIHSIFSGLIAFAPSAGWLAGLRFCGALGMGGTWTSGAALVGETC